MCYIFPLATVISGSEKGPKRVTSCRRIDLRLLLSANNVCVSVRRKGIEKETVSAVRVLRNQRWACAKLIHKWRHVNWTIKVTY